MEEAEWKSVISEFVGLDNVAGDSGACPRPAADSDGT